MLNPIAYRIWTALLIVSSIVLAPTTPSVAAQGGGNTAAGLAGVGAGAALGAGAGQAGGTTPSAAGGGSGGGSAPIEVQVMAYKGLSEIAADVAEITHRSLCKPVPTGATTPLPEAQTPSSAPPTSAPASGTSAATTDKRPACTDVDKAKVLIEEPSSSLQIALYQSVLGYHDEMKRLSEQLTASFALRAKLSATVLTSKVGHESAILTLSTTDNASIQNVEISLEGENPEDFVIDPMSCTVVSTDHPCQIAVKFNYSEDMQANHPYHANIKIATDTYRWNHAVPIAGLYAPPNEPIATPPGVYDEYFLPNGLNFAASPTSEAPAPTTTTGGASGGGGGAAAQPLSLQYLSGIGTALAGLKSGIAYSSAAAQPTTQSFEVLVANELLNRHIYSYTATSPLQLQAAADSLSHDLGDMLRWGAQVDYWTTACKPAEVKPQTTQPNANDGQKTGPAPKDAQKPDDPKSQSATPNGGGSGPNDQGSPPNPKPKKQTQRKQTPSTPTQSPECKNPVVIANLATATQLIAAYTALLQNASDGNGTPVMVDVLRGAVLSAKLKAGMPSLQLSVAVAAGSSRTNAFFFVNLFYLPKPSYNAGVIATFELRDPDNELLKSGVRTAFYDYNKKWLGAKFDDHELNDRQHCQPTDTFCVERKREK